MSSSPVPESPTASKSKHVVALSGGKDSTAMAIRLAEVEPRDYLFVCTPTGNEPAAMFAHWRKIGDILGSPILPINFRGTLDSLIDEQGAIPNWRQRWCTRMLKIEPFANFLRSQSPATSYVGLRADEPEREGGDYASVPGVEMRFPLREWGWGLDDVLGYLGEKGIEIPKRTDCSLCFFQRLIEWYELWRDDRPSWDHGVAIEEKIGHTFRSPGRDTWPAGLKELGEEFAGGRIPRDTRPDAISAMQCRVCRL